MIDRAACRPVLKGLDTGPERAVDSGVSLDFRENVPIIPTHSFLMKWIIGTAFLVRGGFAGNIKREIDCGNYQMRLSL